MYRKVFVEWFFSRTNLLHKTDQKQYLLVLRSTGLLVGTFVEVRVCVTNVVTKVDAAVVHPRMRVGFILHERFKIFVKLTLGSLVNTATQKSKCKLPTKLDCSDTIETSSYVLPVDLRC